MNKIRVSDKPLVKTQRFEVSIPNQKGIVTVIRTEIIRQLHQMGCTDGLPDDYVDHKIEYEVYKEVDMDTRVKAIVAVESSIRKVDKNE